MVKKIDRQDYLTRLISLLIAVGLWLYVVYAENPQLEFWVRGISVEYSNQNNLEQNNLVSLTSLEGKTVSVRVKGRRKNLSQLTAANVTARINLGDISHSGSYYLPIDISFNIPGVEVVDKNPYNFSIVIDDVVSVKKPVRIEFSGLPKENYSLNGYTQAIDSIDVTGPSSVVGLITEGVAMVDVSGVDQKKSFAAPIQLWTMDGKYSGEGLSMSNASVGVTVDVLLTKSVKITPQIVNSENMDFTINLTPQTVALKGTPDVLRDVEEIHTEPVVINSANPNMSVEVGLVLPPDTSVVGEATHVKVEIAQDHSPAPAH